MPHQYLAPPAVYLHGQKWAYFLPASNACLSVLSHTSSCTDHLFVCSSSHAVCLRVVVLSFVLPLFSPCLHIPSIDKIRNRNSAILLEKPHCSWLVDGIIEDGINAALRNASQRPSCIIKSPSSRTLRQRIWFMALWSFPSFCHISEKQKEQCFLQGTSLCLTVKVSESLVWTAP